MKKMNEMIIKALEVLNEAEFIKDNNNKVSSEFKGYISALGAAIRQQGLLPTLAAFEDKNAKTQKKRIDLAVVIKKLIVTFYQDYKDDYHQNKDQTLLKIAINERKKGLDELKQLQKRIVEAGVAIKFALRTFEIDKESSNE